MPNIYLKNILKNWQKKVEFTRVDSKKKKTQKKARKKAKPFPLETCKLFFFFFFSLYLLLFFSFNSNAP